MGIGFDHFHSGTSFDQMGTLAQLPSPVFESKSYSWFHIPENKSVDPKNFAKFSKNTREVKQSTKNQYKDYEVNFNSDWPFADSNSLPFLIRISNLWTLFFCSGFWIIFDILTFFAQNFLSLRRLRNVMIAHRVWFFPSFLASELCEICCDFLKFLDFVRFIGDNVWIFCG